MNKEYRIIIAGSRQFSDYSFLEKKCLEVLYGLPEDAEIIIVSGNALGADKLGESFAL